MGKSPKQLRRLREELQGTVEGGSEGREGNLRTFAGLGTGRGSNGRTFRGEEGFENAFPRLMIRKRHATTQIMGGSHRRSRVSGE